MSSFVKTKKDKRVDKKARKKSRPERTSASLTSAVATQRRSKTPQELRGQFGTIPFRVSDAGELEVLFVLSKSGNRVLPKGNLKKGESAWEAAWRETMEETSLTGCVSTKAIGALLYDKPNDEYLGAPPDKCKKSKPSVVHCRLHLFVMRMTGAVEGGEELRDPLWVPIAKAGAMLADNVNIPAPEKETARKILNKAKKEILKSVSVRREIEQKRQNRLLSPTHG